MRDLSPLLLLPLARPGVFPSPCGVRRVRDVQNKYVCDIAVLKVSVPLRGKEGAGPWAQNLKLAEKAIVSFPSPCGVRRVRDARLLLSQ